MTGHLVPFAAFLVEPHPRAPALLKIILHPECDDRADAGESIAHQPEEGAVAQANEYADINRVQQLAHLVAGEHRRLAARDSLIRSPMRKPVGVGDQ